MKKILLIALIYLATCPVYSQHKVAVAAPDCLVAYQNAYNAFNLQFRNDIRACGLDLVFTWVDDATPGDAIGSLWNADCGWNAYYRLFTNLDLAADLFVACSGLEIIGPQS
ncbi:MAG: hypothetical protein EOO07_01390 [Chitinophagaceae bacterium]|nr:MAG: hypothetical protein EOO07_01390 [Chitinophagaceae bacterium]